MSENAYNIKEDIKLARTGVLISRLFAILGIIMVLVSVAGYLPNEPLITCSIISTGVSAVMHIFVSKHVDRLQDKIRNERWREEENKLREELYHK